MSNIEVRDDKENSHYQDLFQKEWGKTSIEMKNIYLNVIDNSYRNLRILSCTDDLMKSNQDEFIRKQKEIKSLSFIMIFYIFSVFLYEYFIQIEEKIIPLFIILILSIFYFTLFSELKTIKLKSSIYEIFRISKSVSINIHMMDYFRKDEYSELISDYKSESIWKIRLKILKDLKKTGYF